MPKLVEVPKFGVVEFPDSMGDEFIASEIDRLVNNAPGPAKAPIPKGLQQRPPGTSRAIAREWGTDNSRFEAVLEKDKEAFREVGRGVKELFTAPGARNKAAAASRTLRGAMAVGAKALPVVAVTNPIPLVLGLVAGTGAQMAVESGAKAIGVPEEYARLGGDIAGLAAGGRAAKAATPARVSALTTTVKEAVVGKPLNPVTAMVKAVRPIATNIDFERNLKLSMPYAKEAEAKLGRPVQSVDDAIEAVKLAKQDVWAQREQHAGPARAMNAQVNLTPVAEAMEKAIPNKLRLEDPHAAAQMLDRANNYRRQFSLAEAEQLLKESNAELDSYYSKYPTSQRAAATSNPDTAATKAQAEALRGQIYKTIDGPGQGAVPRELGQRYGALLDLEHELYRRKNVAARQAPENLTQQLASVGAAGQVARAGGKFLSGDIVGAAGDVASAIAEKRIANFMRGQNSTDALIADAFKNWNQKPIVFPAPKVVTPRALLGPGDIITPPPADASGVRAVPGMYPTGPNPAKALPPATTRVTPPPADGSYVKAVPAQYPEKVARVAKPEEPIASTPERSIISPDERNIQNRAVTGERQAVLEPRRPSNPSWSGKTVTVEIPGEGRSLEARYVIRELDDVHPSHSPDNFQPNPAYQHKNDRNYGSPANAERVIRQAKNFKPSFLLDHSIDASNGAPVIDANGNVLGGNSRTMTLGRVYNGHPEHAAAYRAALEQRALEIGIDPANIRSMKKPVLARELLGEVEPQRTITDLNKVGTAALEPAERALADSRRLSERTLDFLQSRIEQQGQDGTLAQALEGPAGAEIINRLVDDGILTPQERQGYVDPSRQVLTPEAKSRISRLMIGRLFRDSSQMENTPADIKAKLERAVAPLAKLSNRPEWDITPEVQSAVDLLQEMRARGLKNPSDVVSQVGMFQQSRYSPEAIAIALKLNEGPRKVEQAFRQYAADEILSRPGAPATFYEPPSKEQSFAEAFAQ